MSLTVQQIAERLDGILEGDGVPVITGLAGLQDAEPGRISFVANSRYYGQVADTRASAVIVPKDWDRPAPCALIRVSHPDRAFARVAEWYAPPPIQPPPGIHATAIIAESAVLGEEVSIGPHCVVEEGARIGDRTVLFAGVYVGHETQIGCDGRLYPHVSIRERVQIGDRVIIHNGSVIGSDGFGYTVDDKGVRTKIPQIGTVWIGDDVEIGAQVAIDRARFGRTRIGNGVKIDNLVQIAHNVRIDDHAIVVAQSGIAGSTKVGRRAILAGQSGVSGHLEIGEGAIIGAQAGVTKSVPPKTFVSGYPAAPHDKASKIQAHVQRLPDFKQRVDRLEERIERLESSR